MASSVSLPVLLPTFGGGGAPFQAYHKREGASGRHAERGWGVEDGGSMEGTIWARGCLSGGGISRYSNAHPDTY